MSKDRVKVLVTILKKIPLFEGLSPSQIQSVLSACQPKRYEMGETLCASGTEADEMFVLLSGALGVLTQDGTLVATLSPVTTVGEMGIVMRQKRKATVETLDTCNVLVIPRTTFEQTLKADEAVAARIYRNIISILAEKIVQDNVRMRDYLMEKVKQEERLKEWRLRAQLAEEMAVSESELTREEVESRLEEQMLNTPKLRVLIVDDEPDARRILGDTLADYDIIEARDGEEALDEIGDDPPDLVITDIRMPGMDGYALVKELKERHPDTPVLAISGFVSVEDVNEYGFDGFVEKPMNLREFRGLVDDVLESH